MTKKKQQLRRACEDGMLDEVKRLVDEGVDFDGRNRTPLMDAARNGHIEIVLFLLDRGANINKQDKYGNNALRYIAEWNAKDEDAVVRLLIERGADLHKKNYNGGGTTPLRATRRSSTAAIIKAAMQSTKAIFTTSQDLKLNRVTYKHFNTNIIILTENNIPDGYEFHRKPTFTLQHIQQLIDQLMAIDDDTSSNQQEYAIDSLLAQHHPAIYQRMQYWKMNLLHLMVYFSEQSNYDRASLILENCDTNGEKQILSSLLDLYSPQAIASVDIHGMTPLHHAVINSTRQRRMSQDCYELLLTKSPSIVIHRAIRAGMDWNQLCPIIMAKLNALTVEDEETGLMPFMIAAEKYHNDEESGNANDMLLVSLTMAYELLCLQPDVMKEYDVSINTAKRSYKDMSGS